MRTRPRISLTAAAAVAAVLGLAGPVLASPNFRAGVPAKKSTRFAGYELHGKNGMTDLTTTIVVPKLKCGKADRAIAPTASLYQDSLSSLYSAGLFVGCASGKAHYFPFLTVNGNKKDYEGVAAHPGDSVTLEVAANTSETVVNVFDSTHPFSKARTAPAYTSFVANPWIGAASWRGKHGVEGIPNFGTITFGTTTTNGNPFLMGSDLKRFNLYNQTKSTLEVKAGGVSGGKESFAAIFKHS